jgi:hypothetical protein
MPFINIKRNYNPIQERHLEDRSFLTFEFPKPSSGGGIFKITLPFFENIRITERKRANYQKYDLLSRPSQLFTYTGSQARKFTLSFDMTFPHILQEHGDRATGYIFDYVDVEDTSKERGRFKKAGPLSNEVDIRVKNAAKAYARDFSGLIFTGETVDSRTSILDGVLGGIDNALGRILGDPPPSTIQNPLAPSKLNVVDLIVYWTNLIRASAANYSPNPIYGPPIVRINHGILFQGIPCVCNDYSIQPIEDGGYDLETLLPRKIRYSMTLSEVRAGDFGEWNPDDYVARDNVVGWEAVVQNEKNTMDPGRFDLQ